MHTHIWEQFISPESVAKILKRFGCDTVLVRGVEYQVRNNIKLQIL